MDKHAEMWLHVEWQYSERPRRSERASFDSSYTLSKVVQIPTGLTARPLARGWVVYQSPRNLVEKQHQAKDRQQWISSDNAQDKPKPATRSSLRNKCLEFVSATLATQPPSPIFRKRERVQHHSDVNKWTSSCSCISRDRFGWYYFDGLCAVLQSPFAWKL